MNKTKLIHPHGLLTASWRKLESDIVQFPLPQTWKSLYFLPFLAYNSLSFFSLFFLFQVLFPVYFSIQKLSVHFFSSILLQLFNFSGFLSLLIFFFFFCYKTNFLFRYVALKLEHQMQSGASFIKFSGQ